jgi:uncharacterized protein with GYD domain
MGAKVKGFYVVMGMAQYDMLVILEAPNDDTVAKAAFNLGSLDNVRTETHRAFTEDEFKTIVAGLP